MKRENVILGEGCVCSTDCKETGLNNNIIVCGGSGCGKTMSVSEARLLETVNSSLIAAAAKRRIVNKYKPLFKERGYRVCDLDFVSPERGDIGYNPLSFVKTPSDITFIASSIVKADPGNKTCRTDPFWDDSAISLLSAEIACTLCENENASFADVLKLNDVIEVKPESSRGLVKISGDEKFRELEKKYAKKTKPEEKKKDPYKGLKAQDMICALEEVEEGRFPWLAGAQADEKWEFARRHALRCAAPNISGWGDPSLFEDIDDDEFFRDENEKPDESESIYSEDILRHGFKEDENTKAQLKAAGGFPEDAKGSDEGGLAEDNKNKEELAAFALSCWNTFRFASANTASCICSLLNSILDRIFSPEIRRMTELEKQVDFEGLARSRTVLFVTTSPVNPSLNLFINMFYAHAIKQLFEFAEKSPDGALPVPVHILCDDFAAGGRIQNFPEYISIFREKKISTTLLLQSESQLLSMYGADAATTIINNCDTYIYMGGMDFNTARNVSLRLDAPYDEILRLKVGEEIVFRRGQKPVRTQRYNINSNALYREITRDYEERINFAERGFAL